MKKSRKEFIKKAHEQACSEWKDKIEKEFPKLFPKEEFASAWYKHSDGRHKGWLMYCESGSECGYGFNTSGAWASKWAEGGYIKRRNLIHATKEEIEEALIKEAKKRGYVKGTMVKCIATDEVETLNGKGFKFNTEGWLLAYSNSNIAPHSFIYHKGKWAEIVETITKEEA